MYIVLCCRLYELDFSVHPPVYYLCNVLLMYYLCNLYKYVSVIQGGPKKRPITFESISALVFDIFA